MRVAVLSAVKIIWEAAGGGLTLKESRGVTIGDSLADSRLSEIFSQHRNVARDVDEHQPPETADLVVRGQALVSLSEYREPSSYASSSRFPRVGNTCFTAESFFWSASQHPPSHAGHAVRNLEREPSGN